MNKKQVRICYTDFWITFDYRQDLIYNVLREKYDVIIDNQNPDYVIFSCFGSQHLQFDNSIKIYVSGENVGADFNFADYAISSEYLEFGDRYFRLPLWRYYLPSPLKHHPRQFYEDLAQNKTKFCNFIYSNGHCAAPQRRTFFELLSKRYKQVDSGGKYLNNIGNAVNDKIAWQRDYKFSIAFENSSQPGYATEKIIDALKADTIPIYWGDPCLVQELNPKRFINVHDFDNFEAVIEEVKRLDQDDKAYIDMLAQPWFGSNPSSLPCQDNSFKEWLFHIFEQDKETAQRITYYGMRAVILQQHQWKEEILQKRKRRKKFVRKIEMPFRILRNQFYKLCRKS